MYAKPCLPWHPLPPIQRRGFSRLLALLLVLSKLEMPSTSKHPAARCHGSQHSFTPKQGWGAAGDSVLMGTAMHHPVPWRTNPWVSFTKDKRVSAFSWSLHQVSVYWQPTGCVSEHFRNPFYKQRGAEIISQKFSSDGFFFFFFNWNKQTKLPLGNKIQKACGLG